jgi:Zn finger protein HypA/HybF involved in hydrogenase expression
MMQAVSMSEMSVCFYETTQRNIPKESHLHSRRRENLKCQCAACQEDHTPHEAVRDEYGAMEE